MKKIFLVLFLSIANFALSQDKIVVESGNFDFLKDQTEVNVQVKFDNVLFQAENYNEAQYLERREKEAIAKKGEEAWKKWVEEWGRFKEAEYITYFLKGINVKSRKVKFTNDNNAKYTLIIDTKWIFAGWHGGIVWQEAKLTSELSFVETQNPQNVLMKIKGDAILGKSKNEYLVMEYGRIAGAYEETGKDLGREIRKVIK